MAQGCQELLLHRVLCQSTHSAFVSCCGLGKADFPSRSTEKVERVVPVAVVFLVGLIRQNIGKQ